MNPSTAIWLKANAPVLVLSVLVAAQWIAIQFFAVHYHFFRKSLKRPRPDGVRMATLEKVASLQAEQMEVLFGKVAELRREISKLGPPEPLRMAKSEVTADHLSPSMGEITLKKRLLEIQGDSTGSGTLH